MYLFLSTSRGNRQIEKDTRGSRSSSITRRGARWLCHTRRSVLERPLSIVAGVSAPCGAAPSTRTWPLSPAAASLSERGRPFAACAIFPSPAPASSSFARVCRKPQSAFRANCFPPVTSATAANSRSLLLSRSPLTPGSRWHSEGVGEAGAAEAPRGACGTAAIWAAGELPRAVSASTQLFGTGDAA